MVKQRYTLLFALLIVTLFIPFSTHAEDDKNGTFEEKEQPEEVGEVTEKRTISQEPKSPKVPKSFESTELPGANEQEMETTENKLPPTEDEVALEEQTNPSEQEIGTKEVQQSLGVLGVSLLTNVNLTANHTIHNETESISLTLTGNSVLDLDLLTKSAVIFQLPPEVIREMDENTITASYDVPGLLGIIRNRGNFDQDEITIDRANNQVRMDIKSLINLSLLGAKYEFTLDFDIDHLPPPDTMISHYTFYGHARDGDLIDLSLLEGNTVGTDTIDAPEHVLAFHRIPSSLDFVTTELPTIETVIPRQKTDWAIEVMDTRGPGSTWQIRAQAEPLTLMDNPSHQLPNALVFIHNSEERILTREEVLIHSGQTSKEMITHVQWNENEGPLLKIGPSEALPGEYETTITWKLVDAP